MTHEEITNLQNALITSEERRVEAVKLLSATEDELKAIREENERLRAALSWVLISSGEEIKDHDLAIKMIREIHAEAKEALEQ